MADGDPTAMARLRALYGAIEQAVERILGTPKAVCPCTRRWTLSSSASAFFREEPS